MKLVTVATAFTGVIGLALMLFIERVIMRESAWIGAVQGLCLPFRGFSRSGSTISTGMFLGLDRMRVEEFSFALAVVLTPPVILKEGYRLSRAYAGSPMVAGNVFSIAWPSLVGMLFSFVAGLIALRWISTWLEHGRWHYLKTDGIRRSDTSVR